MKILVLNDTSYELHVGCLLVKEAYQRLFSHDELTFKSILECRRKQIPADMALYDLVLINGEGSLHHNGRASEILLRYVTEVKRRVPDIKVGIVNSIWYKNSAYINLLELCDFFYARDKASLAEVSSCSSIEAKYCPDFVYYALHTRAIKTPLNKNGIIFQNGVKGLFKPSGEGIPLSIFIADSWIRKLKNWKRQITKSDIKSPSRLFGKLNEHFVHKTFRTVDDFISYVKSRAFIVSGRYHMIIISIYLEIPFKFYTSNTPKVEFHLKDILMDPNSRVSSGSEIYRKKNIISFTDDEEALIKQFKVKIPEFYASMLQDIMRLVNGKV